jgi:hypothetical protein
MLTAWPTRCANRSLETKYKSRKVEGLYFAGQLTVPDLECHRL